MSIILEGQNTSFESPLSEIKDPFGKEIPAQIDHLIIGKWIAPQGLLEQSESSIGISSPKEKEGVAEVSKEAIHELPKLPQLQWESRTHPLFTSQICDLLESLWAIVSSRALQLRFRIKEANVSIFADPTEEETKAILQLACDTNIVQALAFWDSLEPDFQNLLKVLSESERTIFLTKIALRIYWLQ